MNLTDALAQSAFATMGVLSRIAAENDLSLTQLRVFGILRDRRLRMAELADYLGLEKSTMSGLVDRAEKRGLVERAPSAADGRAVDVALTAGGAELAERLYAQVAAELSASAESLNERERHELTLLLAHTLPRQT